MPTTLQRANHCFAAGAVGGLITTFLIWVASQSGAFLIIGVPLVFEMTPGWLYQRIVWGGLWGLVFLPPVLVSWRPWRRGLILGLAPAAATLLLFNPIKDGIGLFGLGLGPMMPVVVVLFSLVWGAIAGWYLGHFADIGGAGD
jgi:hypothetical protein